MPKPDLPLFGPTSVHEVVTLGMKAAHEFLNRSIGQRVRWARAELREAIEAAQKQLREV